MRACLLLCLICLIWESVALAKPKAPPDPRIALHDLPGTDGEWQEGVAVINAPQAAVRYWLTDYANWAQRFPDIAWSQVLPDDARGDHVIRFHSRTAGRTFVVHEAVRPDLLVFYGAAPNIFTQGRIYMTDIGAGRTRVYMQSTAQVKGVLGIFATKGYRRKSAFQVTGLHLGALLTLADQGAPAGQGTIASSRFHRSPR